MGMGQLPCRMVVRRGTGVTSRRVALAGAGGVGKMERCGAWGRRVSIGYM